MSAPETSRLLAFARELQGVATFEELLLATRAELEVAMGFKHAWLFVADKEDVEEMRLIDIAGSIRSDAWIVAPVLKIKGDAMLEEIVRSDQPVVVADARTDPNEQADRRPTRKPHDRERTAPASRQALRSVWYRHVW